MEQRSNDAAVKDAQNMLPTEECAEGMEQRPNYAMLEDVGTNLRKEGCVQKVWSVGQTIKL